MLPNTLSTNLNMQCPRKIFMYPITRHHCVGAPPFLSVKVANFLGLFLTEEADSLAQDAFSSAQTILFKVTSVIEFLE